MLVTYTSIHPYIACTVTLVSETSHYLDTSISSEEKEIKERKKKKHIQNIHLFINTSNIFDLS